MVRLHKRTTVRQHIGIVAHRISWWAFDAHDSWLIEYRGQDGRLYGQNIRGRYSAAKAFCKEHRGKIVGHNAECIPVDGDTP